MNPEILNDKYGSRTFRALYDKAVETVAARHEVEVNAEYDRLNVQLEKRVATVRIFAESHPYKGFPKISCIKLIRQVYGLTLKEAKDVVDHAMEVIPELRTGQYIPNSSILP